jgi:hypothetical protein
MQQSEEMNNDPEIGAAASRPAKDRQHFRAGYALRDPRTQVASTNVNFECCRGTKR